MLSSRDKLAKLASARLMLIFTPEACGSNEPMTALADAFPHVDAVQVRPKPTGVSSGRTSAIEALEWTRRVLALRASLFEAAEPPASWPLVLINDRADVARALLDEGCDGVHLGQEDAPPRVIRDLLGDRALIGLSTHDARQVVLAGEEPVDYLGFGPVFASATKGYAEGLGTERAWIAAEASGVPVFPIGGIELTNVGGLDRIGRAAVSSAVLAAKAPGEAAASLRAQLGVNDLNA